MNRSWEVQSIKSLPSYANSQHRVNCIHRLRRSLSGMGFRIFFAPLLSMPRARICTWLLLRAGTCPDSTWCFQWINKHESSTAKAFQNSFYQILPFVQILPLSFQQRLFLPSKNGTLSSLICFCSSLFAQVTTSSQGRAKVKVLDLLLGRHVCWNVFCLRCPCPCRYGWWHALIPKHASSCGQDRQKCLSCLSWFGGACFVNLSGRLESRFLVPSCIAWAGSNSSYSPIVLIMRMSKNRQLPETDCFHSEVYRRSGFFTLKLWERRLWRVTMAQLFRGISSESALNS